MLLNGDFMSNIYIETIKENPGITRRELAEILGINLRNAWRHLKALEINHSVIHDLRRDDKSIVVDVLVLSKKKGSRTPYKYKYEFLHSVNVNPSKL